MLGTPGRPLRSHFCFCVKIIFVKSGIQILKLKIRVAFAGHGDNFPKVRRTFMDIQAQVFRQFGLKGCGPQPMKISLFSVNVVLGANKTEIELFPNPPQQPVIQLH